MSTVICFSPTKNSMDLLVPQIRVRHSNSVGNRTPMKDCRLSAFEQLKKCDSIPHRFLKKPGKMHSDFHSDLPFKFGASIIAHLSQSQAKFRCNVWRHVTSCDVITWPKKTNWNADLNWSWKIICSENKKQIVDKNCLHQDSQDIFLSLSIKISKKWHPNRSQNETNWNPNRNRSNAQFDIESQESEKISNLSKSVMNPIFQQKTDRQDSLSPISSISSIKSIGHGKITQPWM